MEIEKTTVNSGDNLQIRDQRMKLLNMICATLIHEPTYYAEADSVKVTLTALVNQVATQDPEFIFKLAYYVREELNIRSTANFLLALAANKAQCHPFFPKWFNAIIRLPSDMLEVATLYTLLPNKYLTNPNSIPTALRKAILKKFPSFDVYQLAKYNKERAQKRKAKKEKETINLEPKVGKPSLMTLKQIIRKVHLDQPAEYVMAIVGKKYPKDEAAFAKTGLKGEFDPTRASKPMKLPTPETWETLLSAKGNKHTTWQELLDHKKLPFMAMLRNIRNFIVTGISPEHHQLVISKLTDERTIASSRQLPWQFLSAYDSINVNLEELMNDILDNDGSGLKVIQVKVRGRKGATMTRTIKKRVIIPVHMPDHPLIAKYRDAIDTAVKLATMKNLTSIEGKTVVFVDVSGSMDSKCKTKKMGTIQTCKEIAILLGLMIQFASEECDFRIFSSPGREVKGCDISIPLEENTILRNIERVVNEAKRLGGGTDFPYEYLEHLIKRNTHIDNFIILSDMMIAPGHSEMERKEQSISSILAKYRKKVNPNMKFFAVDLFGSGKTAVDMNNPLNILISGFSDNILRFIAMEGNGNQLEHVMNIDKEMLEKNKPKEKKPQVQK